MVLEAYSASGASLLMGLPIAEGSTIMFCAAVGEFLATVRPCGPAPKGYLGGVYFDQQPGNYVAEHLLDLSLLSNSLEPEPQSTFRPCLFDH